MYRASYYNVYTNQRDAQVLVNNLYFFVNWLYIFRTVISQSSGATFHKLYRAVHSRRYVPALEDGTDRGFRNVGRTQMDAGDIPKRTHTIFKTRRKSEIKIISSYLNLTFFPYFATTNTPSQVHMPYSI